MIVIYAEKSDRAISFAAAIGGIALNGKTYNFNDLGKYGEEIKKAVRKQGYIKLANTIDLRCDANIAGKECYITWGEGHVGELKGINEYDHEEWKYWNQIPLPYIPKKFQIKGNPKKTKYINNIKKLFNDPSCECIVSATDYGREGELIFDFAYRLSGTRVPYFRARFNETTEDGIRKGFAVLYSSRLNYASVMAARMRNIADWTLGINLTIGATVCYRQPGEKKAINVGRVITPTLNLLVEREKEIQNYKESVSYFVKGVFQTSGGEKYEGILNAENFLKEEDAENFIKTLSHNGVVKSRNVKSSKTRAHPFSTSSLQAACNKVYGMPIEHVDTIAQSLYDKGFITYPRTESEYLNEDMHDECVDKIKMLSNISAFRTAINDNLPVSIDALYFDNTKTDDHPAIITTMKPATKALSQEELKVYFLIAKQYVKIALPPLAVNKVSLTTAIGEFDFKSNGQDLIDAGYTVLNKPRVFENSIPKSLKTGDTVKVLNYEVGTSKSKKPTPYTDATLVKAMLNCGRKEKNSDIRSALLACNGIGTGATRANIFVRLIASDLAQRNNKGYIRPTERGIRIIDQIDIPSIKTPEMTALWELKLHNIEQMQPDNIDEIKKESWGFLNNINLTVKIWCDEMKKSSNYINGSSMLAPVETDFKCPMCGKKLLAQGKLLKCSDDQCDFVFWKNICNIEITDKEITKLLNTGKTGLIHGFKSKKDKEFSAYLYLDENKQAKFTFESDYKCPKCGSKLYLLSKDSKIIGYKCQNDGYVKWIKKK